MKFMKLIDSYVEFKSVLQIRNLSESTLNGYTRWIRRFLNCLALSGIKDTSEIELRHAREFTMIQNKNYSARTYNCCVCAIMYYYEGVLIKSFPKRYLPYSRVKKDNTDSFTDDQLWELICKAPDSRMRAAIVLAADTGMRVNEVTSIRFRDIDKKNRTIVIENAKRNKSRTVEYSEFTRTLLNAYVADFRVQVKPDFTLFPRNAQKPGEHMSGSRLSKQFHDFLQGFSFYIPGRHKFHSLRHYFATSKVDQGAQLLTVRNQMGHTSSATTEIYVHSTAVPETTGFSPLDKWPDRITQLVKEGK